MEELYFSYVEALELTKSKLHLKGTSFTAPKSRITYQILTIMPAPLHEIDELRDLMADFIEKKGGNKTELDLFESRLRDDRFTVMLWALGSSLNLNLPARGANLLSVPISSLVNPTGQIEYGFEVYYGFYLF